MTNIEKYKQAFNESFGLKDKDLSKLTYQSIDAWDSVGHMQLVATVEAAFNIMMETDDIISFNSFVKGIEILKKYGVNI